MILRNEHFRRILKKVNDEYVRMNLYPPILVRPYSRVHRHHIPWFHQLFAASHWQVFSLMQVQSSVEPQLCSCLFVFC